MGEEEEWKRWEERINERCMNEESCKDKTRLYSNEITRIYQSISENNCIEWSMGVIKAKERPSPFFQLPPTLTL